MLLSPNSFSQQLKFIAQNFCYSLLYCSPYAESEICLAIDLDGSNKKIADISIFAWQSERIYVFLSFTLSLSFRLFTVINCFISRTAFPPTHVGRSMLSLADSACRLWMPFAANASNISTEGNEGIKMNVIIIKYDFISK